MELVLNWILDESSGGAVGAESTESHSFLDVEDLDHTGEIACREKSSVGTETDGGDNIAEGETAGGGKRLRGKEGDGGGVSDGQGVRVDRRESQSGYGGDEIRCGMIFEGGPVPRFRSLRFGNRFRR